MLVWQSVALGVGAGVAFGCRRGSRRISPKRGYRPVTVIGDVHNPVVNCRRGLDLPRLPFPLADDVAKQHLAGGCILRLLARSAALRVRGADRPQLRLSSQATSQPLFVAVSIA
jgi:hypothetical protein